MPKVKLQRKNHVSAQYIQPKLPTLQTIEHCAGIFFYQNRSNTQWRGENRNIVPPGTVLEKNDFAKLCIYDRVIVANYAKSMMG